MSIPQNYKLLREALYSFTDVFPEPIFPLNMVYAQ